MTGKIKRRSLRCGGRPKADFGSIFNTFIAPALGVAGSVADSAIAKHQVNKIATTPAANTQIPEPKSNPEPKVDATGNNGTTVLPPDPTKTPAMRLGGRKKCWIGTAIMGATSIAGSLFGAAAQKREMRRQKNIQDWQNTTQEAANMTSALNNSQDYQEDYLRQFRTAARLGKTLGAKGIYITDGGDATNIGNNTYLLRGGSHEDVNETGQTGIGINVGGNEVEAEGGEVAQKKNGALRIFSAQPILGNGMSPAQAILRGYNKDKVFSAQQQFKKRHHLSDDGETYKNGGVKGPTYNKQTRRWYNAQGKMLRVGHGYYSQNSNRFVQYNTDGTVSRFSPLNWRDKEMQGEKHTQSMRIGNKSIGLKPAFTIGKGAMYSPIRVHKVQLKNNKNRGYTIDSEDITNDAINIVGGGEKLFGKKFKVQSLNTKFAIPYGKGITINGREVSKNLLDSIAYNAGLNKYPIDKLTYAYGLPSQESHNGRIASGNIVNKNKSYNTREYNNAIANMNVFKNFGVIPANVVVRNWSNKNDAATDKKNAYNLSTNLSPLYQSFDLFRRGLYNTGDKNHTNDVKTAGDLIINSPEFKTYWETSGKRQYTRGYNDTNKASSYDRMINSNKEYSRYINHYPNKRLFKLGGRCKLRNGGKPTFMKPNNDAMNIINHPANETPYIPQRHNRSRTIFSDGDYLGLGIDTLAALSTGLVNYNTAGKYTLPDRAPIIQASKLPTTYNVNPEIEEVKRYRDRLTGQTFNNTSSSVAALNRSSAINLDALSNLSKLWATKENEENKMLTEDAKNQQTVAAQNVQNELARQSEIARIKNEATQAKGDALNVGLSGLSQAWTNFWTAGRTAYEDDQSRRAMIASSKEATPTRLMEMDFDLSPDVIASLYRTAKEDRTKRFYLSRLSPKQRQRYGIN